MHITPSLHMARGDGEMPPLSGLPIIALQEGRDLSGAVSLLQAGASQVLAIGDRDRPVQRLLIYTQPSRPARDGALSAAGSLLRHMNVDATLLVPADERFMYGSRYRDLLDIRETSLRMHGVDVRTESFRGNVVDDLRLRLQARVPTLLLVGMTSTASGSGLVEGLAELMALQSCAAILLTSARSDVEIRPALPDFRPEALARAL
jgi:hypothetical protein